MNIVLAEYKFLLALIKLTTQNKICIISKHVCKFCIDGKNETNIHLEQPFYLLRFENNAFIQ